MNHLIFGLAGLILALSACTPTPTEPPPHAQTPQATELRDTLHAPLEQAKALDTTLQQAADQQRQAIDAATAQ